MALQEKLNVSGTLTSPGGTFELAAHDGTFPTEAFTREEADLFEQQLNDLIMEFDSSVLGNLLQQRQDVIAKTAAFAKQELDGKVFGGINAGDNQIGFSILRPGHIYQDSSGTIQNDWYFDPGTTGWTDWIGDGSTNNYSVGEDQVSLVLAFADQDVSTEVSGVNVQEFGRNMDMLPHDVNDARLMDNDTEQMVKALPSLVAQDNDSVHIRLRYDRDVESQPRLYGFTFGLGSFLNSEDF